MERKPRRLRAGTVWGAPLAIASLTFTAGVWAGDPNQCDVAGEFPDVIVGDIHEIRNYGNVDNIWAFSMGTKSCNVGTCWLKWFALSTEHPVIGQNMFRLKEGRFEHVGQSWVKHGFNALSEELCNTGCLGTSGTYLGVNCSDPYRASTNGSQGGLGPKFQVNATTGVFIWPHLAGAVVGDAIYKRLQVQGADLDPVLNPGAQYFVEAQYVTPDDAAAGRGDNNASWRTIDVLDLNGFYAISLTGSTQREQPAIHAWKANDGQVFETMVDVPGEGRFIVAARATALGGGLYHYEYAVQNLNAHRAAESFSVSLPPGANVTNLGFHDVDYHSGEPFAGTDWTPTVGVDSVLWTTVPFGVDPDANALRWGTLYNFRFDVDVAPDFEDATIKLFRPGGSGEPNELQLNTLAPALGIPPCDPYDDDQDEVGNACDDCPGTLPGVPVDAFGCSAVTADFDGDGDADMDDFAILQACLTGGPPPNGCEETDLDGDSDADGDDAILFGDCMSGANVIGDANCPS